MVCIVSFEFQIGANFGEEAGVAQTCSMVFSSCRRRSSVAVPCRRSSESRCRRSRRRLYSSTSACFSSSWSSFALRHYNTYVFQTHAVTHVQSTLQGRLAGNVAAQSASWPLDNIKDTHWHSNMAVEAACEEKLETGRCGMIQGDGALTFASPGSVSGPRDSWSAGHPSCCSCASPPCRRARLPRAAAAGLTCRRSLQAPPRASSLSPNSLPHGHMR